MMDRIIVTAADIKKLLAWRDEHKDLVRSMPIPLREVEIQIVESGISIKCFRSDKKLKLYIDGPNWKLGRIVFAPLGNGLWKKKVSTLSADCNPAETEQGALTVYGSLMALMAYGTSETPTTTEVEHKPKAHADHKRSTRLNPVGTTYNPSLVWKAALCGSQRPPRKPKLLLHCSRSLPALQEREDRLDCRIPKRNRQGAEQDLQDWR